MTGMTGGIDLAAQVLDLVRAQCGAGTEAEVVVTAEDQALTRFANSFIHQNMRDVLTTVRLRLHVDGRTAGNSITVSGPESLAALVERTVTASRLAPVDPGWPGLTPPSTVADSAGADPATAQASPAERAARVRAFVDAAGGLEAAGYCRTTTWRVAFANSAGQSCSGSATEAAMDGIARTGSSDGLARFASTRLADLDGSALGARARAKAAAGADPVELAPGRYQVVLEPTAVADLLMTLGAHGFNGKAYAERRSFAVLGEQQFDPAVTLLDNPLSAGGGGGSGLMFDAEGTPKHRLGLVVDGVTTSVAHDRRTAAQAGTASTGHSVGSSPFGPIPANLYLRPRTAADLGAPTEVAGPAADSAVAALVADVDHGLLVTDNWYTRVLDPRTMVVTGLTRNGVWLIEQGEVTKPVANLRFTQSYVSALRPGSVLGIGTAAVGLASPYPGISIEAPALRLASWNYTGGASG
jgi:predicted Zn-dependent protease